ncbi:hypothetical protein BN1723_002627 [Verticillium longisporum]|uniref:Uncharacterized protein n=1 Tax=Verticillium longisporum TaxID=100787 RepID=A0A0G4LFF3_VERLO|nr:hypothetical protein BN1723_002627 [Verticillium longisporum]
MSLNLPIRTSSSSQRNQASRNYFTNYTPPSSTEAINGPVREPARELLPPADRLIVGVDFGTTFSGVAAVYTGTPDDIEIIKTWPGGNGITSDKVPTEIAYTFPSTPTSPSVSSSSTPTPGSGPGQTSASQSGSGGEGNPTIKWGFQFRPEESRLRCIKLFLDRSQKLPFYVSPLDTAAQLRSYDKTVIDAVSDYLTQIYAHTMDTLTRRYGESFMASTKVDWVLTCPAVWSDAAKNTTLQAAERAGMGEKSEIQMISEPEAAAVYTLKAIQPNHLNVNDNFIVCDAGGGTVDLIAYKIMSLNPLQVEESAVGTGGLCGSAFLNYRFEEHVRNRIGHSRFDEMKVKKGKTWQMGLRYFEEFVKRNFNEDEHHEVNVPFPGLPDDEEAGLDCGFLVMTAEQVKDIFEPVVKEVCDLVQGQVRDLRSKGGIVSGIILVGGFGQSDYLYRRLKTHFASAAPPPYTERPTHATATALTEAGSIEVMQPVYAWTAVVRGAVLRGLEVTFDVDANGIINISAVEKGTGKSNKIVITNDKGRLSKEEIERMLAEAEKYKEEDEAEGNRVSAKNGLESYAYSLRNTLSDPKVEEKLDESDKTTLTAEIDKCVAWLDENQQATKEEYEDRQKELEGVANPIMMKFYGAGGAPGGMPGGMPGGAPGGPGGPGATHDDGPTVEEVD